MQKETLISYKCYGYLKLARLLLFESVRENIQSQPAKRLSNLNGATPKPKVGLKMIVTPKAEKSMYP